MSNPYHEWFIGKGERRSVAVLTLPKAHVLKFYRRPGVALLSLAELWVAEESRNQGHAHTLMSSAIGWAASSDIDLWLRCCPYDLGLRHTKLTKFYRQYGFKRVSPTSPDYEMIRRIKHV